MARKVIELTRPAEDNPRPNPEDNPRPSPEDNPRPKRANALPTDGYAVEVDGKLKTEYPTAKAAFEAGSEIKKNFPAVQVKIYDAKDRTRTTVDEAKAALPQDS